MKIRKAKEKFGSVGRNVKDRAVRTYLSVKSNKGGGWIEYTLIIAVVCVIGALVIAGMYSLFHDVVIPTITQKANDMFSYGG